MLTGPRRGEISALRWRHIDAHTVELLTAHRQRWEQRLDDLGLTLSPEAFVFSTAPDGLTPYMPRAISQRYRKLALKLKLRSTRLHSLRHYSETELVAASVDIRTVAGRLGHGSGGGGATTLMVYAGWVNEADRRAADTMATIVPRPVPAPVASRGPYQVIAETLREQIRTGQLKPVTTRRPTRRTSVVIAQWSSRRCAAPAVQGVGCSPCCVYSDVRGC